MSGPAIFFISFIVLIALSLAFNFWSYLLAAGIIIFILWIMLAPQWPGETRTFRVESRFESDPKARRRERQFRSRVEEEWDRQTEEDLEDLR